MVWVRVIFEIFESMQIFTVFQAWSESSLDASFEMGLTDQKMGLVLDAKPSLEALVQV